MLLLLACMHSDCPREVRLLIAASSPSCFRCLPERMQALCVTDGANCSSLEVQSKISVIGRFAVTSVTQRFEQ